MIKERLHSEICTLSEVSQQAKHCIRPTFVVAKQALHADGKPTVFHSYLGEGIRPSKCPIWQAARATSAAPSFFKAMYISNPLPGINYIDGGLGHNNPAEVSLEEGSRIWPNAKRFCLVSRYRHRSTTRRISSQLD